MSEILKEGTYEHTVAATLMRIEKKLDQILNQTAPRAPSDDETVGRNPSEKYWQGADYKGIRLSECPPDFLRAYSRYRFACVFMARKENNPEKMKYVDRDEKSAKLALEWAEYREAMGYKPEPTIEREEEAPATGGDEAGIPF